MPRESDILDPAAAWFHDRYVAKGLLLIHEEPQGRGGRRPDILVVFADGGSEGVDDSTVVPVEIVAVLVSS